MPSSDPGHEQVHYCSDEATGLRAIIAIYSTTLGPALGGTRFYPYPTEDAALADVLDLSRAMAYKAACAGLRLGGGKAVIIGDPERVKTVDLLRAYGRCVDALGGRYYTACDIGTNVEDMAIIAQQCRYVTGRPEADGGAGDSSLLTAYGVFRGMCAAAEYVWGEPTLRRRRVGVLGAGKVGSRLVEQLRATGASVVVADVNLGAVERIRARNPEVEVTDPDKLPTLDLDVFAPCALGDILNDQIVERLQAAVVCGGANNQLASPRIDAEIARRGIRYAPDYVVNAGGLIQVAAEISGDNQDSARAKAHAIFQTTRSVFAHAESHAVAPGAAADHLAEQIIAGAAPVRPPSL
jgi:valine dehydrogenase (NAD+)